MQRSIFLNDGRSDGRSLLWSIWGTLRDMVNQPGCPYSFGSHTHGDAMRDTAKAIEIAALNSITYDDQLFQFVRSRSRQEISLEDEAANKLNKKYSAPRNLVICEGGVRYLQDLVKRFYTENRITTEEAERFSAHLYAIFEGQSVTMKGARPEDANVIVHYESFTYRDSEYRLSILVPGEPRIYHYDDVSWKPFFHALHSGSRCEIDEAFYYDRLEGLPPAFMNSTVELVDGTRRFVCFGAAEGDNVPIEGYWQEGKRFFAQMTKLRTR